MTGSISLLDYVQIRQEQEALDKETQELADLIFETAGGKYNDYSDPEVQAKAIISAGWRKVRQ